MSDVERWREELQQDLHQAEWRLDDLVIAIGAELPHPKPGEGDASEFADHTPGAD